MLLPHYFNIEFSIFSCVSLRVIMDHKTFYDPWYYFSFLHSFIIPLLHHFTIFGQQNAQNHLKCSVVSPGLNGLEKRKYGRN